MRTSLTKLLVHGSLAAALILSVAASPFDGFAFDRSSRETVTKSTEFAATLLEYGKARWAVEGQATLVATNTVAAIALPEDPPVIEATKGGATNCPWSYTKCPQKETECPVVATVCQHTICPVVTSVCPGSVYTVCPVDPTNCPKDPTKCEVTVCPKTDTLCPFEHTKCPKFLCDQQQRLGGQYARLESASGQLIVAAVDSGAAIEGLTFVPAD
ncbi:MAG: hypothetical protein KDC87_08565 [Planctomycetes bacterium]|nr:hypothetical protein [Planctomycetota bacterium]